jgi:hypothetical protein
MADKQWMERTGGREIATEKLADGSFVAFDAASETVISLNSTVHAAYSVLEERMSLEELRHGMSRRLGTVVPEEVAEQAVAELEGVGLVTRSAVGESAPAESRRAVLQAFAKASGYAIPAAMALKASEQKLFALTSGSGPTTTTTTTSTTTTSTTTTSTTTTSTTTTTTPAPTEIPDDLPVEVGRTISAPNLLTATEEHPWYAVCRPYLSNTFPAGTYTVTVQILDPTKSSFGPGTLAQPGNSPDAESVDDPIAAANATVSVASVISATQATLTVTLANNHAWQEVNGYLVETWTPGDSHIARFPLYLCGSVAE